VLYFTLASPNPNKLKNRFSLILALLMTACSTRQEKSTSAVDSLASVDSIHASRPSTDTLTEPNELDALGLYMAGLEQEQENAFKPLEKEPSLHEYKTSMDSNWNQMYETRLTKMKEWQAASFSPKLKDSLRVFYPFSGPDFLHCYYLYPATKEYIFAALEPIYAAPKLDTLGEPLRKKFLDSLGHSLRDIFHKSYFITSKMKEDIKNVKGVLPPIFFFVERTGHELTGLEFFHLDSLGTEVPTRITQLHWHKTPGVKLSFKDRSTGELKQLYYFSISLSNQGLLERPEFETFLKSKGPFNTFMKSASYLLHRDKFTAMKKLVLDNSQSLFQDDTGVPYRDFRKRLDWNIQLYGEYVMPVKEFGETRFQPDLDSAYRASKTKEPLPFSLGYHWGTRKQNYMLVRKSPLMPSR
jgi:hypothetical protein